MKRSMLAVVGLMCAIAPGVGQAQTLPDPGGWVNMDYGLVLALDKNTDEMKMDVSYQYLLGLYRMGECSMTVNVLFRRPWTADFYLKEVVITHSMWQFSNSFHNTAIEHASFKASVNWRVAVEVMRHEWCPDALSAVAIVYGHLETFTGMYDGTVTRRIYNVILGEFHDIEWTR